MTRRTAAMPAGEEAGMAEFVRALLGLYAPRARAGQGLVEYGLAIVLVAIAVVALLALLGGQLNSVFSRIASSIQGTGA
jgi:Flp pilus assembly pilin Flp